MAHKREGVQPKKRCLSYKFFNVLFPVTQFFLLGFSWSSVNITATKKKNMSKNLSGYLK